MGGSTEMLEEESMSTNGQCASTSSRGREALALRSGILPLLDRRHCGQTGISCLSQLVWNIPSASFYFLLIPSCSWDWAFLMTNLVWGADKNCCILGKSSHFILLPVSHDCGSCRSVPKSPVGSGCTSTEFLDLWSWWPDLWPQESHLSTAPEKAGYPVKLPNWGFPQTQ